MSGVKWFVKGFLFLTCLMIMFPASVRALDLWAINADEFGFGTIEKFDVATGARQQTFDVSADGRGIAVIGNTIFFTGRNSLSVSKADATTGVVDTLPAFTLSFPVGVEAPLEISALSFDGTNFWVADYTSAANSNRAFKVALDGTVLMTITLSLCDVLCDGLEFFNGKLIANRFDGGFGGDQHYDIYKTDGTLLQADFINTSGHGFGTGIAFDGTNFFVSDITNSNITVWNGATGAFIGNMPLDITKNAIEDLSFDFARTSIPEPGSALLLVTGLMGWGVVRRFTKT